MMDYNIGKMNWLIEKFRFENKKLSAVAVVFFTETDEDIKNGKIL